MSAKKSYDILMDKYFKGLSDCVLGLLLVIFSVLAIVQQSMFVIHVFDILAAVLIVHGIHEFKHYLYDRHRLIRFCKSAVLLLTGCVILFFPVIPLKFMLFVFSVYLTVNAAVKFLTYMNYRKDKVKGRSYVLLAAVFLMINGLSFLVSDYMTLNIVIIIIGFYALLLGITYILDGIFAVLPAKKKDGLKRRIRIPLPMAIAAFIPVSMSYIINQKLETKHQEMQWDNNDVDLEVFVHVSKQGFGIVGHCDLFFAGEVLSYGNYDQQSTRLFEAIGDGVLFSVKNKKKYLEFCIKEDKKTIFGYGLKLTELQKEQVKDKIDELKNNAVRWYPLSYYKKDYREDYASRLFLETEADFYKFQNGKFKTYFVLGSNCVLLADQIIGSAGTDIIDLNGIIAPGTYQEYLEKEYQRQNGFVICKNVYHI